MAIVLEKSGDKHRINLEKGGKPITGEIKINLDWVVSSNRCLEVPLTWILVVSMN